MNDYLAKHKRTLVINWGELNSFGGIEKHIFYLIKTLSQMEVRIIWMKNEKSSIGAAFLSIINSSPNIEIINVSSNHLYWFRHEPLIFNKDEEIVVESYTVFDMLRALTLQKEYSDFNIKCIYGIPDTTGKFYYIERYFKGWFRTFVFKKIRKVISDWNNANMLVFFSPLQITALEKNYNIKVSEPNDKLTKELCAKEPIDEVKLRKRSLREDGFNIITVGRFDFPHKGYMLGMVKSFGRLKSKYPQLTMTFIGHGKDESVLKSEINKLPLSYQKDITIIGAVPYNELMPYFDDKHLSIAVAGGVIDAASAGVLSLVARNHYSKECEVYGFMPEIHSMGTSSAPGIVVDCFIEEAINMSNDEYYNKCKSAFDYLNNRTVNPLFLFERAVKCSDYKIKTSVLLFFKVINYIRKFFMLIRFI